MNTNSIFILNTMSKQQNICKINKVYNQKTKRCDIICEEKLIYNTNKDICECEIGKYYIEETSKCYLMCKKRRKIY